MGSAASAGQGDLFEDVLERGRAREGVEEKLDRVLSKLWTASQLKMRSAYCQRVQVISGTKIRARSEKWAE